MDGYCCLLIAIINGVGASTARRLYDYGPEKVRAGSFLPRGQPSDRVKPAGREERNRRIQLLRKKGYSLEAISAILNCDSSTVKRNLKKKGSTNNDTGNICRGNEDQDSEKNGK